ncbi:MAG: hypothetical protein LC114_01320 [Bryobacterales bacterium]|nr:hypothetical protein [Bryobacterales bacterium]
MNRLDFPGADSTRFHLESRILAQITLLVFFVLAGCGGRDGGESALGKAYAGAMHVPLYTELEANAKMAAELRFGDEVHLLRRRRNFYFVRGPEGKEGWTHRTNLFNQRQLTEMKALAQFAADAPSQGEARVFAPLNVHNYPSRGAPSVFQISEGERVDVLAHERHARQPYDPGPLIESAGSSETAAPARDTAEPEEDVATPPAPPPPPGLPRTWLRLSGLPPERIASLAEEGLIEDRSAPSPAASGELWTLVRNKQGLAGWALQARLVAAIPESVAQYSEGARITSYFALAPADSNGEHQHWLWTTLRTPNAAFDFDSYRVFTWNGRLRRYETSLIVRDVEGYLPVEVFRHSDGGVRFRINIRERGGLIHRRTYELTGVRTRLVQSVPWPNYDPLRQPPIMDRLPAQPVHILPSVPINLGPWEKLKDRIAPLTERISGS